MAAASPSLDRSYWSAATELGWTSLLVSEEAGGGSISGRPFADLAVLADESGHHVAPGPLIPCNVVAWVLSRDNADQAADHLDGILDGRTVAAWALAEGNHWDPAAVCARADRGPGGYAITGVKHVVEAGPDADIFLVSARDDDGVGLFVIDKAAPGVTVTRKRSLDPTRTFGTIEFTATPIPATARVGGDEVAELAYCAAIAIQSAETAALMRHAFDMTLDWVAHRYAFGRVVGSYQAIKHRLAEHYLALQVSAGVASALATALDEGSPEIPTLASAAKAYMGDSAVALVQDAIQLHGGIGMTWEHDLHLYLRRASTNRTLYGGPAEHRERLCRLAGI